MVEFINGSVSCITLKGQRCVIIVVNIPASSEDKDGYIQDRFYEETEGLFGRLAVYHMKILLGEFNANVRRENVLQPTIGNESVHPEMLQMVLD